MMYMLYFFVMFILCVDMYVTGVLEGVCVYGVVGYINQYILYMGVCMCYTCTPVHLEPVHLWMRVGVIFSIKG